MVILTDHRNNCFAKTLSELCILQFLCGHVLQCVYPPKYKVITRWWASTGTNANKTKSKIPTPQHQFSKSFLGKRRQLQPWWRLRIRYAFTKPLLHTRHCVVMCRLIKRLWPHNPVGEIYEWIYYKPTSNTAVTHSRGWEEIFYKCLL